MDSPFAANTRFAGSSLSIGLVALGVCLSIWLVELNGWSRATDELAYDTFLSWNAARSDTPTSVVTVYAHRSTFETEQDRLAWMVRNLRSQGVRSIGVTFPLASVSSELANEFESDGSVVLGYIHDQVDGLEACSIGAVDLLDDQAVYREHYGSLSSKGGKQPSLEAMIARKVLLPTESIPEGQFRINYRGGINSLPHFGEAEVLSGELVSEIVSDKVVLIGLRPDGIAPRVATPGETGARMSALELHGHILHTLLTQSAINDVGVIVRGILFTILTLSGFLAYQRLSATRMLPLCVATVTTLLLGSMLLLACAQTWLPVSSVIIGQIFSCAFHLERRLSFLNGATSRLTLQRKLSVVNTNAKELWDSVADQTTQMFFPIRFALLELPDGATHARIVKTVNCDDESIEERRRDSRRAPYSTAVAQCKPYISETRPFFHRQPGAVDPHVVVPLTFAGEVLGFVILEFETGTFDSEPGLLTQLQVFAEAVGASVAGQRATHQQSEMTLRQYLTAIPEEGAILDVVRAEELSRRRLDQLERLFEQTNGGLGMYDAFGQLIVMNTAMRRELQRRGLVASETSTTDLIAALSGRDHNVSRDVLRDAALGTKSRELNVPSPDGLASMLFVHPLNQIGTEDALQIMSHTDAVLIEFVPSDPFAAVVGLKDRIITQLCVEFDRKVEQLHSAVRALADGAHSHESVHQTASMIKDDLIDLQATLRQGRAYLVHTGAEAEQCLPVCALELLKSSLDDFTKTCGERRIAVDRSLAAALPEVIANPKLLEQTFRTILALLVETAFDETTIVVASEDQATQVIFRFANQGHGTATDRLRDALQNGHDSYSTDQLGDVRGWLELWGGHMTVATRPGEGIEVQLTLRIHKWASQGGDDTKYTTSTDRSTSLLELPDPPTDRPSEEVREDQ